MRRRLARRELPVSVTSTMASARVGGLTSVAPQLNSTFTGTFLEVAFGDLDELGGDGFSGEVFGFLVGRVLRDGEHPADLLAALFGVDEAGDALHVEGALDDPVDAGESGVEDAFFHVAGHLLGADEHALDLGVVDGGEIGAAIGVDAPSGAFEEGDGGVLQAAFGDAEAEFVCH